MPDPHISPILSSWHRQRSRPVKGRGSPRLKLIFLTVTCVVLGYSVVSIFSSNEPFPQVESHLSDGLFSSQDLDAPSSTPTSLSRPVPNKLVDWTEKVAAWSSWNPNKSDDDAETVRGGSALDVEAATDELIQPAGISALMARPRIAKCTIMFGTTNPVYERALRSHQTHNRQHNYPMYVLRQSIFDDVWSKPAYILSLILGELAKPEAERLEWLLWLDADTILLNPYIPIEIFLPPQGEWDEVHLLVSHDYNGLNNGVFLIRVAAWSAELLSAILAYRHYKPEERLMFRDQSAMESLLQEPKFDKHTLITPQRWFNAYQGEHNETLAPFQVRRGDFLVHFADVPNRDERMRYWLERAERHAPDWEIEVAHTSFPEEIRDFWAEKAAQRDARRRTLEKALESARVFYEQTETQLRDYRDGLGEQEVGQIESKIQQTKAVLVHPDKKEDVDAIRAAVEELKAVSYSGVRQSSSF